MTSTPFDSSTLTKRLQDKTISYSFIIRSQDKKKPQQGSAPLLGIKDASIMSSVRTGHMTEFKQNLSGSFTIDTGCPCDDEHI
jgi:hypothetical protein